MKLTKCEHGHYFDADKFPGCPYCDPALQSGSGSIIAAAGAESPAAPAAPAGPVTGWLVALDGPARGRDLRLGEGKNFIGADAAGAPQVLSADAPLSARQAVAVYDPAAGTFSLLPGSARELCYLNGKALLAEQPLKPGAVLAVGGTALVFVPFCGTPYENAKPAAVKSEKAAKPAAKAPAKAPAARAETAAKPAAKAKTTAKAK